ncbi:hypothetical protein ACFLYD_07040 [Chloroflexota bacterium]
MMVHRRDPHEGRMVHIRYAGRSWDMAFADLDIGDRSSDGDVRRAVANYLNVSPAKLAGYVVERHANGYMTVRPEAVFG